MPIENILCPEMYMLSSENKFVFFRTWEDEKNYDKTFDDGFFFNGEEKVMTVDKLPTSYEEFISQCVTDAAYSVGGLYTDDKDRERYIIDRYQTYLKFHEKATLGSGEKDKAKVENDDLEDNLRNLQEDYEDEYYDDEEFYEEEESESTEADFFKFKTWKEYCDRRFKGAEENTYCRVITESIEPESIDHCSKKFFSTPKTKYFFFDKIWRYHCILNRHKDIQTFEEGFKTELDACYKKIESGEPTVNVVLCYENVEYQYESETDFSEKWALRNTKKKGVEEYLYDVELVDLYKPHE